MRNLFLLLIISLQFSCNKQFIQENSETAREQIVNLKENGALIVRLKTEEKKMTKMRERGLEAQAKAVGEAAAAQNKRLMAAFKTSFDFCPVYFINEKGTLPIKEKGTKANVFLNDNLEIDKSIECNADYILTAEYGQTLRKTETKSEMEKESTDYQGSASEVEVSGLIVKDTDFVPLHRPFPLYVREFRGIFMSRSEEEMVEKLNENLKGFYRQQQ